MTYQVVDHSIDNVELIKLKDQGKWLIRLIKLNSSPADYLLNRARALRLHRRRKQTTKKHVFLLRNLISHKLLQAYLLEILELQKLRKNYLPAGGLFFPRRMGGFKPS